MKAALRILLFVALFLGACSVEIQSTSSVATAVPQATTEAPKVTASPTATQTAPPPAASGEAAADTAVPTGPGGGGSDTTPAATPDRSAWHGFPYLDPGPLDVEINPDWERLGLSGSVLFLSFSEAGQAVAVFDFETGTFAPLFYAPENTWVLSVSAPPAADRLLISYAPPPDEGETQFGYSDLYELPAGAVQPVPLLERDDPLESYFFAFYAGTGAEVYYSWFLLDDSVDFGFRYHVNRLDLDSGDVETVVEDAYWEALSPGGDALAYVVLDPNADAADAAPLRVRALDSGEDRVVLDLDRFPTVDAPFFSPEGEYLYFSAVSETPPGLSWFDRLMGVSPASAHNVPSDWWRVTLGTGAVTRVTEIFDQGMFGAFSPAGEWIAFISSTGLWVMRPDGSDLTQVLSSASFYGNIEWTE